MQTCSFFACTANNHLKCVGNHFLLMKCWQMTNHIITYLRNLFTPSGCSSRNYIDTENKKLTKYVSTSRIVFVPSWPFHLFYCAVCRHTSGHVVTTSRLTRLFELPVWSLRCGLILCSWTFQIEHLSQPHDPLPPPPPKHYLQIKLSLGFIPPKLRQIKWDTASFQPASKGQSVFRASVLPKPLRKSQNCIKRRIKIRLPYYDEVDY